MVVSARASRQHRACAVRQVQVSRENNNCDNQVFSHAAVMRHSERGRRRTHASQRNPFGVSVCVPVLTRPGAPLLSIPPIGSRTHVSDMARRGHAVREGVCICVGALLCSQPWIQDFTAAKPCRHCGETIWVFKSSVSKNLAENKRKFRRGSKAGSLWCLERLRGTLGVVARPGQDLAVFL